MKLVIIIPSITNYHVFLKETCCKLIKEGHTVHLITSKRHLNGSIDSNTTIYGNLHIIDFPRKFNLFKFFPAIIRIILLLKKVNPDLIHGHFLITTFLLSICKIFTPYKIIATLHGVNSYALCGFKKYIYLFVESLSIFLLDHVFVLNKEDQSYLRSFSNDVILHKDFGIGCNIERFDPSNINYKSVSNISERFNFNGSEFVFVFIGRFVYFKGFALVVKSFLVHLNNFPNSKLLLIGDFDEIHESGLSEIEKDSFYSCSSIFNVGWVDNVQDYLSISHVMVFPSFREGFPVCIMESLSMGVPVITINSRGCNEIVFNQFNGYVTNPDASSIAKKMDEIACDFTLYSQLSTNALSVRDKYDRKLFTNNQYDIYKKLT